MYVCERRSCFVVCYHLNNPNTEQEQVSGAAVGSMDGGDDEDDDSSSSSNVSFSSVTDDDEFVF